MAPLTQSEVDSLMQELSPLTSNVKKRTALGMKVYNELFTAKPEYIVLFSRLQDLDITTIKKSEGIKYYGRTFVEYLLRFIEAAANDECYQNLIEESAAEHRTMILTKKQYLSGEAVLVPALSALLKQGSNASSMEKLVKDIIRNVGSKL